MSANPTLQQPVRSSVTRIATSADVREAAVLIAQQNGKLAARLTSIEAKLDRLLEILQTASRGPTT